jgi:hypothetical protein
MHKTLKTCSEKISVVGEHLIKNDYTATKDMHSQSISKNASLARVGAYYVF